MQTQHALTISKIKCWQISCYRGVELKQSRALAGLKFRLNNAYIVQCASPCCSSLSEECKSIDFHFLKDIFHQNPLVIKLCIHSKGMRRAVCS